MATEFDFQISAQHHQADLLAEAAARRLTRTVPVSTRRYRPGGSPTPDTPPPHRRRADVRLSPAEGDGIRPGLSYHGARGHTRLESPLHRTAGGAWDPVRGARSGGLRERQHRPDRRRRRDRQVPARRRALRARRRHRGARPRGRLRRNGRRWRPAVRTDRGGPPAPSKDPRRRIERPGHRGTPVTGDCRARTARSRARVGDQPRSGHARPTRMDPGPHLRGAAGAAADHR